jgi:hypothetical protein
MINSKQYSKLVKINEYKDKSLKFSLINDEDKKSKNYFNRILLDEQSVLVINSLNKFYKGLTTDKNELNLLKTKLSNFYFKKMFDKTHEIFYSNFYSPSHSSFIIGWTDVEPLQEFLKNSERSINFFFLQQNIRQELRFRKSLYRLFKYSIREIDRAYSS